MEVLEKIAREAGEVLLDYRGKLKKVRSKSMASDLVSEADLESQRLIFERLLGFFQDVKVVGEESFKGEDISKGKVFLVDPLDGSLNYVHGFPFYSVSIAFLENGEVLEGVVYLPEQGEMFHAVKGQGAYLNGVKILSNEGVKLQNALIVTGWPYDEEGIRWTYRAIEKVNNAVHEIRILGSCAAELAYLAAGRIEGYFEIGLKSWDIAAGYLIATEAGAVVSSLTCDGMDLLKGEVVAGVSSLHNDLLSLLREVK